MGKKFACGCSVSMDEVHGEVIQVQGDIEEENRLMDFIQGELGAHNIPKSKVVFEGKGKEKKGQKPKVVTG